MPEEEEEKIVLSWHRLAIVTAVKAQTSLYCKCGACMVRLDCGKKKRNRYILIVSVVGHLCGM